MKNYYNIHNCSAAILLKLIIKYIHETQNISIQFCFAHRIIQTKKKMFKKIIEKYKRTKEDFVSRSPRGKWEFVRNIGIFILTLTGVPILDPSYEVIWYSYAPGLTCLDIFISFFYTIWYFIETPLTGILVTPLFGVVIPVIKVLFNFNFL